MQGLIALFHQHQLFTTIHKHYTVDEWSQFALKHADVLNNIAVSTGTGEQDFDKLNKILSQIPTLGYVCIDVANGERPAYGLLNMHNRSYLSQVTRSRS